MGWSIRFTATPRGCGSTNGGALHRRGRAVLASRATKGTGATELACQGPSASRSSIPLTVALPSARPPGPDFLTFYGTHRHRGRARGPPSTTSSRWARTASNITRSASGPYQFIRHTPGGRAGVRGLRGLLAPCCPHVKTRDHQGGCPRTRPAWAMLKTGEADIAIAFP